MDEPGLLRRARQGDRDAFGLLVELHQKTVYNIAWRMVRDEEAAMDLAQEAFLEAWAHLEGFDESRPLAPWLYRIVHNRSLNWLGRRAHPAAPRLAGPGAGDGPPDVPAPDAPPPEARLEHEQLVAEVRREVDRLPEGWRSAFVLRYLQDRSVADVAAILAVPVNTIKTHLFRARERLRTRLAGFLGSDE